MKTMKAAKLLAEGVGVLTTMDKKLVLVCKEKIADCKEDLLLCKGVKNVYIYKIAHNKRGN